MDTDKTHGKKGKAVSLKPIPLVLGAILIAFFMSFVVTSLRNYGGFNYGAHSTSLSNAIFESLGAVLMFPLLHLGIASFWKAKRTSQSRRNIFFGWGVAVIIIQAFNVSQVPAPITSTAVIKSSKLVATSSQLTQQSSSPQAQVQEKVTLGSWNQDLSHFLGIQSTNNLPGGKSLSIGCIPEIRSEDCIKVNIKREPFEMVRIVTPENQVDLGSPGRSARLLPFIIIKDGQEARLGLFAYVPVNVRSKHVNGYTDTAEMNEITVVSNDSISFSRRSVSGLPGLGWNNLSKFGIAGDISSPAIILTEEDIDKLSRVNAGSGVAVRFVLSYLGGGEVNINIGDKESGQFASNFQLMLTGYNSSRGNLTAVGDSEDSGKWLD